jgi:hypothetical protein
MNLTFAILNPGSIRNIDIYDSVGGGPLARVLALNLNVQPEWFQYEQFITFGTAQEFELQVLITCQPPASDIWIDLISLNPAIF